MLRIHYLRMSTITLDYYLLAKISQPIERKCHWLQGNLKGQDNNHSASKCDKIVIDLLKETASSDELLVVITVFITTGRILVQGKGQEDWGKHDFPVLLDIVNQLSSLKSFSNISSVEDKSIFTGSVHNFCSPGHCKPTELPEKFFQYLFSGR